MRGKNMSVNQQISVPIVSKVTKAEKAQFIDTTHKLGTNPSNAIRMFISAFNRRGAFPFDISETLNYNKETLKAIKNTIDNKALSKEFNSVKDLIIDLDA
jgi:DNA-damage-inducible protein J